MKVYLTLDFFLRRWSSEQGELWLTVQPHVESEDLGAWVEGSESSVTHEYELITSELRNADLVPVPFADDSDLVVRLAADREILRRNRRRTGARVLNAALFERDNRQQEPLPLNDGQEGEEEFTLQPVHEAAFAIAYNQALRDALMGQGTSGGEAREKMSVGELADMLKLAFWGGTQRRVRQGVVENLEHLDLMALEEVSGSALPDGLRITNLHSLCGLTLRLGTSAELGNLNTVNDLQLTLERETGDRSIVLDLEGRTAVTAYFSKLSSSAGEEDVQGTWINLSRRAYALDQPMVFRPVTAGDRTWYRRRKEDRASRDLGLGSVRRLVIRPEDSEVLPDPLPSNLTWRLHDSIEGRLVPYRGFPVDAAGDRIVARFLPVLEDAEHLSDLLARDPEILGQAQLLSSEGEDVDFSVLGVWPFPWDEADDGGRTVLLWTKNLGSREEEQGQRIAGNTEVSLVLPVLGNDGLPLELQTDLRGLDPLEDLFGKRWESRSIPSLNVDFDILELVTELSPPAGSREAPWTQIVPGICLGNDRQFVLAQGVSQLRAELDVSYPAEPPDLAEPSQMDPRADHVEDLINYNALNPIVTWGDESTWLSRWGEIYPQTRPRAIGGRRQATFTFGNRWEPDEAKLEELAAELDGFYARSGEIRKLRLSLEHTYGDQLVLEESGWAESPLDFLPALPTRVQQTVPGEGEEVETRHFVTVDYRPATDQAPEAAVLYFDTDLLQLDGETKTLHAAWRSVAELAWAERITLGGDFRRFNVHQALDSNDPRAAAGLEAVPDWEDFTRDLTEEVRGRCRRWLDSGPEGASGELIVPLSAAGQTSVSESCNVVQFFLDVRRDRRKTPAKTDDWDLLRPLPTLGERGQDEVAVTTPGVHEAFRRWREALNGACGVLQPQNDDEAEFLAYRRVLGNRPGGNRGPSEAPNDEGGWILPEGFAITHRGDVEVALCPLGFRPVDRHKLLGDETWDLVIHWLHALQTAAECRVRSWAMTWNEARWRRHFEELHRAVERLRPVVAELAGMMLPLPDPDFQSPRGSVDQRIAEIARLLRDGEPRRALVKWLEQRLWQDLALFVDSKAILLHHLRNTAGLPLRPDFFQLVCDKQIRKASDNELALIDRDTLVYRDAVLQQADRSVLGLPEILDDLTYDNDFSLLSYRLRTLESVVEELREDSDGREAPEDIPLRDQAVHLPLGRQFLGASKVEEVRLASRRPVSRPTYIATDQIEAFQTSEARSEVRVGTIVDYDALLRMQWEEPAGEGTAVEVIAQSDFPRSRRLDDYVLSVLYSVRGDEEIDDGALGAFKNDRFYPQARFGSVAVAQQPDRVFSALDQDLATLLEKLRSADPSVFNAADELLGDKAISLLQDILKPRPVTAAPDGGWIEIRQEDGAEPEVRVVKNTQPTEALVLRKKEGFDKGALFLLVNFEVPVWEPAALGLRQARNLDYGFAPEFGQVSGSAGERQPYQPTVHWVVEDDVVELDATAYSASDLVEKLLIEPRILEVDPGQEIAFWRSFDLSISLYQEQQVLRLEESLTPSGNAAVERATVRSGDFPLVNRHFLAQSDAIDTVTDWFPEDYDDVFFNFLWTSASNSAFFRLENVRVRLLRAGD